VPFAGLRVRVDKIETVAKVDGRPIVAKAQLAGSDGGYIMVTCSVQNPSSSEDVPFGENRLGFELVDGTQVDEAEPAATFIAPGLNDAPSTLHPKQHVQIVFVVSAWNGQPLTKMFLHNMNEDAAGHTNLRFQIRPGYVKALDPTS
jgi:hypothetical protein